MAGYGPEFYSASEPSISDEMTMFCKTCGHSQRCVRAETAVLAHISTTMEKAHSQPPRGTFAVHPWVCAVCGKNPTSSPELRRR